MFASIIALRRQVQSLAVLLTVIGALAAPSASTAESKPYFPLLPIHPLFGTWWAETLYDQQGEAIWRGGESDDAVLMRVNLTGGYRSRMDCNIIAGEFQKAGEDGSISISPKGSMVTLMGCFGDYPPTIAFSEIARFEREGMKLRLYDKNDVPIAVFYNVVALKAALDVIVDS